MQTGRGTITHACIHPHTHTYMHMQKSVQTSGMHKRERTILAYRTYTHTQIHVYIYTHTVNHTCMQSYIQSSRHPYIHTYIKSYTQSGIHTYKTASGDKTIHAHMNTTQIQYTRQHSHINRHAYITKTHSHNEHMRKMMQANRKHRENADITPHSEPTSQADIHTDKHAAPTGRQNTYIPSCIHTAIYQYIHPNDGAIIMGINKRARTHTKNTGMNTHIQGCVETACNLRAHIKRDIIQKPYKQGRHIPIQPNMHNRNKHVQHAGRPNKDATSNTQENMHRTHIHTYIYAYIHT